MSYKTIYTRGERVHQHVNYNGSVSYCVQKHGKKQTPSLWWLNLLVGLTIATLFIYLANGALVMRGW